MSSTFVLPFPTQRLNKSSQIGLEIFKGCLLSLNFIQFGYNRSRLKYRCFNLESKILKTYALSFYRSKMIFDRPNCFSQIQVTLVTFKLIFSALSFIIWTWPKQFLPVPNNLDGQKSFWTYRRTGRKSRVSVQGVKSLGGHFASEKYDELLPIIFDPVQNACPSLGPKWFWTVQIVWDG